MNSAYLYNNITGPVYLEGQEPLLDYVYKAGRFHDSGHSCARYRCTIVLVRTYSVEFVVANPE